MTQFARWYLQAKAAYLGSRRLSLSIFVQNIACISGGYSTKFLTGTLCPEVQPLTLNDAIFERKGTPFTYLTRPQSSLIIWGGHGMERSQETVKEYRRRGRWERRGKRKRESPLFAPSHFPPARASSRRIPRLYLNNSVWTFSFIFLFLLAPEEGLFSNRNIGQFVEYIFFCLIVLFTSS